MTLFVSIPVRIAGQSNDVPSEMFGLGPTLQTLAYAWVVPLDAYKRPKIDSL